MSNATKVRDLMVKITDYAHIPYWLSVRDAISMVRSAYDEKAGLGEQRIVLVFDEKYQLKGILTLKNLLSGIEPRFLRKNDKSIFQGPRADHAALSVLAEGTFSEKCKRYAEKPVSECMTPIRATVAADDSAARAAFIMLEANVGLTPVMDGGKIVGVLRMSDVFNELTKIVLE